MPLIILQDLQFKYKCFSPSKKDAGSIQ